MNRKQNRFVVIKLQSRPDYKIYLIDGVILFFFFIIIQRLFTIILNKIDFGFFWFYVTKSFNDFACITLFSLFRR